MANLIYITDPMCSWCYGFGPELSIVLEGLPDTPVDIVVGGLRPYNTQVMDEALKATLLTHWQHVAEISGLPFSQDGLSREGFIYNTEPACRAIVAARIIASHLPGAVLQVLHALQRAFYAEGLDITQGDVLAQVSSAALTDAGYQINAADFHAIWAAPDTITATHADFIQVYHWQVTGFPTLLLEHKGALDLVTSGYIQAGQLVERLQTLVDQDM